MRPTSPTTITSRTPIPDVPTSLHVPAPTGWDADRVAALADHAARGGVVVVTAPPAEAAWADLLGIDVGPSVVRAEVVVEPTDHPAARNLPAAVIAADAFGAGAGADGAVALLLPREGTATVLATRVHLASQAAVTARPHGGGVLVAVAWPVDPTPARTRGATSLAAGGGQAVLQQALARLWRRADPDGAATGIGILGYGQHGGMGWFHANAALAVPGLRLAAIAEMAPERRDDAGKRFPDAALHDGIDDLLSDDEVDLVVVATPPSTHHALTAAVLRSGRHAVVEKPLCFTAAEADDLLALAADSGRVLTIHQNRRWDADFRAIRRVIDSGRIGEVFNVETFVGGFEHPCRLWHSDIGVSGGRLYDWGAHLIDQTLLLLDAGVPTEVSAVGHKRVWHDVTNLDQVRVRMRTDDGREAEFLDSDVLAVRRPKYVVQGTRGTLVGRYAPVVEERVTADRGYEVTEHHHAEGPARLTVAEHHAGWGLQEVEVPGLPAAPHPFHRALADHLHLGDPVPVDPAEVRDVTAVLEAAHASAHGGGRVVRPS